MQNTNNEKKITTVIFDCFNVLYTPPIFNWVKEHIGSNFLAENSFRDLIVRYDLGEADENEYLEFLAENEGKGRSIPEVKKEIVGETALVEEVFSIAKKLKEDGYKIGLLSNGGQEFFDDYIFPVRTDFKELFDSIVISSHVHMVKPDAAIYMYALNDIEATAEEAVFIDDSLSNVEAAIALGIHGILYTAPEKLIEDLKKYDIHI